MFKAKHRRKLLDAAVRQQIVTYDRLVRQLIFSTIAMHLKQGFIKFRDRSVDPLLTNIDVTTGA